MGAIAFLAIMIYSDIGSKVAAKENLTQIKIENCKKDYADHGCGLENIPHRFVDVCLNLEKCMEMDPGDVVHLLIHYLLGSTENN